MGLNSFLFLIGEGIRNIRRNGLMSFAALGTVTVALTVLGASLWTAYRIHEIAEHQPQKFNTIDVFFNPDTERAQVQKVMARIQQWPDVRRVNLVTKEEAWATLQAGQPKLTDSLPDNPLPDKLEVEAWKPARSGAVAALLRDRTEFAEVDAVKSADKELDMMLGFARLIKVIGGSAALGLFVATLFIVQNTIRLTVFARRREIRTMQLVGATSGFIRFPLLLEGVFHGVIGALIAGGIILFCSREIARFVDRWSSPLLGNIPSQLAPLDVLAGLVALGALIGLVGSHLSLRRFLKQV